MWYRFSAIKIAVLSMFHSIPCLTGYFVLQPDARAWIHEIATSFVCEQYAFSFQMACFQYRGNTLSIIQALKGELESRKQPKLTDMSAACCIVQKFEKNSPKQREISEAAVKMIVKDIRPISIVENE